MKVIWKYPLSYSVNDSCCFEKPVDIAVEEISIFERILALIALSVRECLDLYSQPLLDAGFIGTMLCL